MGNLWQKTGKVIIVYFPCQTAQIKWWILALARKMEAVSHPLNLKKMDDCLLKICKAESMKWILRKRVFVNFLWQSGQWGI